MVGEIVLITSVLVTACIGAFVFARNQHSVVNRIFGILSIALILFPIANNFTLSGGHRLLFIRAVVASTVVAVACLYYLSIYLKPGVVVLNKLQRLGIWYAALVAVAAFTPLVFTRLSAGDQSTPQPGVGAALFLIALVAFPAMSLWILVRRLRDPHSVDRIQNRYILMGIAPTFLLAPLTSFIMPILLKNDSLISLSPLYSLTFVGLVGYAIVKHRLFDIRFFVVRALAYIFTNGILMAAYFTPAILLAAWALHVSLSLLSYAVIVVSALLLTMGYGYLHSALDALTSRVFFRNEYQPTQFISELNRAVVSNLDLRSLLLTASKVIEKNMRLEYCTFGIQTSDGTQRIVGTIRQSFSQADINAVRKITPHLHDKMIITDYISPDLIDLQKILRSYDIAAVARLVSDTNREKEGLGYILLGPKKSGQQFDKKDIETITTIIDGLIVAIQNALRFEEIENFSATLQRRVDEQTRKLRRTNEKLKEMDETKDDFISMASHQLRTPLTSIKGYLSMVLEEDAGKITPMQREMLGQAFFSSQRMVYLIADLLNVSRLKTGKFIIDAKPVNLDQVVEQELHQLEETAAARELKLHYAKPTNFPTLMLDETKTRQVIMNFVDNAIYYTPAGGEITVRLVETPLTIELHVEDNGIGVPKAEQPHLFTKFYRAGNARQARPDGTGLGLFMAKKVVMAQGGSVLFSSEEGKGSTFGFVFSKDKIAAPTPVLVAPARPAKAKARPALAKSAK
ncbi:MAG: Sensor protein resE [Candidatus Saccharibacteria bacterium]|nr:Sensor protein resE [Candidatus Saccharibacteria bacterium]